MAREGALKAARFAGYLDQVRGPAQEAGNVGVLDNQPVHKAAGMAEVIEKRGARLLLLLRPPCSPACTAGHWPFKTKGRSPAPAKPCWPLCATPWTR